MRASRHHRKAVGNLGLAVIAFGVVEAGLSRRALVANSASHRGILLWSLLEAMIQGFARARRSGPTSCRDGSRQF